MSYPASPKLTETPALNSDTGSCIRTRGALAEVFFSPLALLYSAAAGGLLLLFTVAGQAGLPFSVFTMDPLEVAGGRPYFGLLSSIGVLFWCASAVLCLFAGNLLQYLVPGGHGRFFFSSGALSLVLMLDDLFQLHEVVFPGMLGIRQRYVLLAYLLIYFASVARDEVRVCLDHRSA